MWPNARDKCAGPSAGAKCWGQVIIRPCAFATPGFDSVPVSCERRLQVARGILNSRARIRAAARLFVGKMAVERRRRSRRRINKFVAMMEARLPPHYIIGASCFAGIFDGPHPLSAFGRDSHSLHVVGLPSRGILSDQARVSGGGDSWRGACAADRAQYICKRSRWWLRQGSRPRSSNTWLPWAS